MFKLKTERMLKSSERMGGHRMRVRAKRETIWK